MNKIWCPYSGQYCRLSDSTEEHIIPLALGGNNNFTVGVNREINHRLGTDLDGKLIKHPLVASARKHYGLLGHSNKSPDVEWQVKYKGLRATLDLSGNTLSVSAYRSKNEYGINISQCPDTGGRFISEFNFDLNLILSFGCKLALGTSYFLFGDVFREYGYHNEIRALMNSVSSMKDLKFCIANNGGKGFWALSWPRSLLTNKLFPPFFDALCAQENRHLIFTLHGNSELILCISMFSGFFRWYFNVAADACKFPIGDDFELGAVIEIDLNHKSYMKTDLRTYLETFKKQDLLTQ
jgi:hypothetical protein